MKPKSLSRWPLFIVVLVMAALACTCGLPFNLSEITDRLGSSRAGSLGQDADFFEDSQDFVMPDIPGATIPLETGGSIFVPEGAFPSDIPIYDYYIEEVPLLPEGVQPVGDVILISAETEPTKPVLLRLPIPTGVTDPASLVIARIESDGKTTFLMTEIDQNDLVAYTPGFSKFVLTTMHEQFDISLSGPHWLLPGQTATYVVGIRVPATFGADWKISAHGTILHKSDDGATIQAGQTLGTMALTVEYLNLAHGIRCFAGRYISITDTLGMQVSLTTDAPIVKDGDQVLINASLFGDFVPPVVWTWNYGDGSAEGTTTTYGAPASIAIPPRIFAPRTDPYQVRVQAQDSTGKSAAETFSVRVDARSRLINLEGSYFSEWNAPEVYGKFTASTNQVDSPRFEWKIKPEGDALVGPNVTTAGQGVSSTFQPTFKAPGEYLVEVTLFDDDALVGIASLPVHLVGGNPLDAHILSWPDTIKPNEDINMSFRAGGGILIVGGQKGGYKVSVYWGDGSILEENNVAITSKDYQPVIFELSHKWENPGVYTVMYFVEDCAGNIAYAEADIVVGEGQAVVPPVSGDAQYPRWVLVGEPVLNKENLPIRYDLGLGGDVGEEAYEVNEGQFIYSRSYERENEGLVYDFLIKALFDVPPVILYPGQEIELEVEFSHEVVKKPPDPDTWGMSFFYYCSSPHHSFMEAQEGLEFGFRYHPWAADFGHDGNTAIWTLTVPGNGYGDTLVVVAQSFGPFNVNWTYQYETGN